MEIRRARPEDAERCWQIRNSAIRHGCQESYSLAVIDAWTPDIMPAQYRQEIENNLFYVACSLSRDVVATGYLDVSSGCAEALFTLPEYTGMSLATGIMNKLKQEAYHRGYQVITLSSTPNAKGFYEMQGFVL